MKSANQYSTNTIANEISLTDKLIVQAIAKVDRSALGMAIGLLVGLGIFLITNFLIIKEDILVSSYFSLLNQYFWGYSITFTGSLVGLMYGFLTGFVLGWLIAFIRNFVIKFYLYLAKYKERMISVNNFIDYP